MAFVNGIYKHYKGGIYKVLIKGTHTETSKEMVVYKSLKDGRIWIRPAEMFDEKVGDVWRFELLGVDSNVA